MIPELHMKTTRALVNIFNCLEHRTKSAALFLADYYVDCYKASAKCFGKTRQLKAQLADIVVRFKLENQLPPGFTSLLRDEILSEDFEFAMLVLDGVEERAKSTQKLSGGRFTQLMSNAATKKRKTATGTATA